MHWLINDFLVFQDKLLSTMIITDDIEELAIMKHRFESFEHEMNASASKVAVVNQLARQLLQVEHPNAQEVIQKQNDLNTRYVFMGDLRLSGSIIRKSRFIFTKEWRTIRRKSGCLNHSNERIFQGNIQMQGQIKDFWNGCSYL